MNDSTLKTKRRGEEHVEVEEKDGSNFHLPSFSSFLSNALYLFPNVDNVPFHVNHPIGIADVRMPVPQETAFSVVFFSISQIIRKIKRLNPVEEIPINQITTKTVQDFLCARKHLSYKYLNDMRVFLAQIMDSALRDGWISVNPAKDHRIFNPSQKQPVERQALTIASVKEILPFLWNLSRHDRLYLALVIFTGMRRGEVLGLRWEDISGDENLIHVKRNITYTNNQPFVGTPKTKSGFRTVPILDDLLIFLSPLELSGYIVFGADEETPMTLQAFRCMEYRIRKTIDLHGATAHVFRHTMGTMLNDANADVKTIQSILGQSDYKTTMDRYVHPREDKKQEAIKKVGLLLQG